MSLGPIPNVKLSKGQSSPTQLRRDSLVASSLRSRTSLESLEYDIRDSLTGFRIACAYGDLSCRGQEGIRRDDEFNGCETALIQGKIRDNEGAEDVDDGGVDDCCGCVEISVATRGIVSI